MASEARPCHDGKALQSPKRPSVIWLQLQECTGCVESVSNAEPTIGDLLLDVVSLDYKHTLMAGAGDAVERAKSAMDANRGQYWSSPDRSRRRTNGIYTVIGGRTAQDLLEEAASGAAAILALGACAHWGSVQAARPNPTGAVGVRDIISNKPIVNIAGCPPIGDVVTATAVHYLTFAGCPPWTARAVHSSRTASGSTTSARAGALRRRAVRRGVRR